MEKQSTERFDLYLETLFELYESTSLTDTQKSLQMALDKVNARLLKQKGEFTKAKLQEYKNLITDELQKSYGGLFEAVNEEQLKVGAVVSAAYGLNEIPRATIEDLISSKRQVQGYDLKELFKVTGDNHERALRTLLASEVAQGRPPIEIAKMLAEKNDSLSKGQLRTAIFTTISESREIVRETALEKLNKGLGGKYLYNAVLDSRTHNYCREHDGKLYDTKEEISKDIKVHFNCRSVAVLVVDETLIPKERASIFGPTQNVPYSEWVKNLSDEQQKTILGRKYDAYKNGTYKINGLADVKNAGVSLNLKDIKSAVVHHNEESI